MNIANLHPYLVSFPIALISVVFLLELLALRSGFTHFRQVAKINLYLATAFSLLAFLSGYPASEVANQSFIVEDHLIAQHHNFGRALLFTIFPCCLMRVAQDFAKVGSWVVSTLYWLLLLASLSLVIYTGMLGGKLVFDHGAGVRAKPTIQGSP